VSTLGPFHLVQVAKTESFAARLSAVQILVLDEVDQLASVAGMGTWGVMILLKYGWFI